MRICLIVVANYGADADEFSSMCVLVLNFFRYNTGQLTSERYSTGQHRSSQQISGYLSHHIDKIFS